MDGSRSGGLLAATWAAMVSLGREGYLRYAKAIFATSARDAGRRAHAPVASDHGHAQLLFSFTSDDFDVYHVNDFLRTRGWRLNGQQYPNAIHMDVTRPQTQPGVAERWATDLAEAVAYAEAHAGEPAKSSARSTAASRAGMTDEADSFIRAVMADMLDQQSSMPVAPDVPGDLCLASTSAPAGRRSASSTFDGAVSPTSCTPCRRPSAPRRGDAGRGEWWDVIVGAAHRLVGAAPRAAARVAAVAVPGSGPRRSRSTRRDARPVRASPGRT